MNNIGIAQRGKSIMLNNLGTGKLIKLIGQSYDEFLEFVDRNFFPKNSILQSYMIENLFIESIDEKNARGHEFTLIKTIDNIDPKLFINKASLEITNVCNFNCKHCYNRKESNEEKNVYMNRERWSKLLNSLRSYGCLEVIISGGEPFCSPDIFYILDLLEKYRLPFSIQTNGSLCTQNVIQKLSQYNMLTHLYVSVYGINDRDFKLTTQTKYSYNFIFKLNEFARRFSVSCIFSYIYLKTNYESSKAITKIEKEKNILLRKEHSYIFPSIYGEKKQKYNLSKKQITNLYRTMNLDIPTNLNPLHRCISARCNIGYDGSVSICDKLKKLSFGNVIHNDFSEIWINYNLKLHKKNTLIGYDCKFCQYNKYCVRCDGVSFLTTGATNNITPEFCKFAKLYHLLQASNTR